MKVGLHLGCDVTMTEVKKVNARVFMRATGLQFWGSEHGK